MIGQKKYSATVPNKFAKQVSCARLKSSVNVVLICQDVTVHVTN